MKNRSADPIMFSLDKGKQSMTGKLAVVSTPIGNLEDITFRAVRTLKEVSVIAAEDTRRTQKLCAHYHITTPLTSYHDFNKEEKTPVLINRMIEGADVALVSDAGTPLISDPGYYLITHAVAVGIPIVPVPGPSAILAALTISALPPDSFIFLGFLPRKRGARAQLLARLADDPRTLIVFESPHRLLNTLELVRETLGSRRITIARELTKLHEEVVRGTVDEMIEAFRSRAPKGEITLVIEGNKPKRPSKISDP
ncbi:MAG: 16S rRNA (cytidine(1402)-2'-O)-methyltransferase [Nitrospirae bacterium]|nr:MAG: 16S rRNA (cytidine(1402)-2'-O)-methyltransferase [Nitrospirota bacterium]